MSDRPNRPVGHQPALCLSFDVDGIYGEANYQSGTNTYAISRIDYPVETGDVWIARADQIAAWWLDQQAER